MRQQPLLQIGSHTQGGRGDEPIAIVNAATILLKAVATATATLSRAIGKVFQIGLTAIGRNTIDCVSISDMMKNMTNASRKWRLRHELPLRV